MTASRANQVGGSDYTSGSLREDLANFITLVSAEQTPFLSTLATNKAKNPRHEWQTDTLVDPASNVQSGSFEFDTTNNVTDTPDRLSNYTQVFGKTVHIEGSLLRSDPAGAKNWFQYAMNKRKVELRRDIERKALLYNNFTVNGDVVYDDSGTARKLGGIAAYTGIINRVAATTVELNTDSGTGVAITTTQGDAFSVLNVTNAAEGSHVVQYTAAPTNVSLTLDDLNSIFQVVSENGGDLNTAMIPTGLKTAVTKLLIDGNGGAAQRRADEMSRRVNIAVDAVMAEFVGEVSLVHNYIMQSFAGDASNSIYLYDNSKIKRTVLQSYDMEVDQTARYGKGAIVFCEETIEVADPSSLAMVIGTQA